jgi:hypothetical protein
MRRSAIGTSPVSYSKRVHTFRTAGGNTSAARTCLGSPSFVSFNVASVVPSGLIRKLATEHRPACVEDGLRHPRLRKPSGVHIADNDQFVLPDNSCGLFVKVVAPRVGDLGVDRLDAGVIVGALRDCKSSFVSPIMLQCWNRRTVSASRQRLQPEINADLAVAGRKIVFDLALESDVPAPTRILRETTGADVAADVARLPEVERALEIGDDASVHLNGARDKWDPSEGALWPPASAKTRMALLGVPRDRELTTDGGHSVGVQSQLFSDASAKLDQVESGRPTTDASRFPAGFGLTLDLAAVIPNLIARPSVAVQVLARRPVLDTVFEREQHAIYLLVCMKEIKCFFPIIVRNGIPSANWSVIWFLSRNTVARFSTTRPSNGFGRISPRFARHWAVNFSPVMASGTTSTLWLNTRRSSPSRCWSMRSRARRADCCVRSAPTSRIAIGKASCGRHPILPRLQAARRSRLSNSMLSSNGPPPRPKGRGFRPLED